MSLIQALTRGASNYIRMIYFFSPLSAIMGIAFLSSRVRIPKWLQTMYIYEARENTTSKQQMAYA